MGSAMKALVVDDAEEYVESIGATLRGEGFVVSSASDGETAIEAARSQPPDLIVLDLGLPGMDGVEVCRAIRTFCSSPIIMLTVRDDEVDKVIGLSVGADDYMVKPFSARELIARVRAILRRTSAGSDSMGGGVVRRIGDLEIDTEARVVRNDMGPIELTKIQFDILALLSSRPRMVFSRLILLQEVWGENWYGDDHVIDVHVADLRKRLGDDPHSPRYIRTVRGVGYAMVAPEAGG